MKINDKGNPTSSIWFLLEKPYEKDLEKGYILSGSMGFVFDKELSDTGISQSDCFFTSLKPDLELTYDDEIAIQDFTTLASTHKPPLIVPLGYETTGFLIPLTRQKKKPFRASLDKYAGSLLTSPWLSHSHYCIPTFSPDYVCSDWAYRDIQVSIDLGRVREELFFYKQHGRLQPLPEYNLVIMPDYANLQAILEGYLRDHKSGKLRFISMDIETIRPTKKSQFRGNPGFPYTIAFAPDSSNAISFSLWDYPLDESVKILRLVEEILMEIPQIGQNYFSFDSHYMEAFGCRRMCLDKCHDTMLRHHILWPELEHKLQFLTKQYTRQPFYKDEGKHWSPKNKKALMHYNALDAVVTYAVWEGQEAEFVERPQLK